MERSWQLQGRSILLRFAPSTPSMATALALGEELEAVVTYDARMAEAARAAGLQVEMPE